jgi:hypothetical protein
MHDLSWIFCVLHDLRTFSKENRLLELEKVLSDAEVVARIEFIHFDSESNYQAVMDVVFPEQKAVQNYSRIPSSSGLQSNN